MKAGESGGRVMCLWPGRLAGLSGTHQVDGFAPVPLSLERE